MIICGNLNRTSHFSQPLKSIHCSSLTTGGQHNRVLPGHSGQTRGWFVSAADGYKNTDYQSTTGNKQSRRSTFQLTGGFVSTPSASKGCCTRLQRRVREKQREGRGVNRITISYTRQTNKQKSLFKLQPVHGCSSQVTSNITFKKHEVTRYTDDIQKETKPTNSV